MNKLSFFLAIFFVLALSSCSKEDLFDLFHPKKPDIDSPEIRGGIYTMTNDPMDNQIITYQRLSDGSIIGTGPVSTGGKGTNLNAPEAPTFNDPLGTQDPLIMGYDNQYVFAVNAGSNDVTAFKVTSDYGLMLADIAPAGGTAPVSLASYRDWLYVVNAGDGGNIYGYYVKENGTLEPIPYSNQPLDHAVAGNIEFSPDGKFLIVSEKNTNNLTIFPIDAYGKPNDPLTVASNGPTPFGAVFTKKGTFVVTEAFGGAPGDAAVSSYKLHPDGNLSLISGSIGTHQTASCWIELTDDDVYGYTSNTPDGTISSYRIETDGTLTLLESVAGETMPGAFVLDAEIAERYLYVVANTLEAIAIYRIEEGGSLTYIEQVTNPRYDMGEFTGITGF